MIVVVLCKLGAASQSAWSRQGKPPIQRKHPTIVSPCIWGEHLIADRRTAAYDFALVQPRTQRPKEARMIKTVTCRMIRTRPSHDRTSKRNRISSALHSL
jgi:hypothetical protein